jgi:hypothetical protein
LKSFASSPYQTDGNGLYVRFGSSVPVLEQEAVCLRALVPCSEMLAETVRLVIMGLLGLQFISGQYLNFYYDQCFP